MAQFETKLALEAYLLILKDESKNAEEKNQIIISLIEKALNNK